MKTSAPLTLLDVFEQIVTDIQSIAALTKDSGHECAVHRVSLDDFYLNGSAMRNFMLQQHKNHSHKLTVTFPTLPPVFAIAGARGHPLKPSIDIHVESASFGVTRHDLPSGKGNILWTNLSPNHDNHQDTLAKILQETRQSIGAFIAHCAPEIAAIIFFVNPAYTPTDQILTRESNALMDMFVNMEKTNPDDRFKELKALQATRRRVFY